MNQKSDNLFTMWLSRNNRASRVWLRPSVYVFIIFIKKNFGLKFVVVGLSKYYLLLHSERESETRFDTSSNFERGW